MLESPPHGFREIALSAHGMRGLSRPRMTQKSLLRSVQEFRQPNEYTGPILPMKASIRSTAASAFRETIRPHHSSL